MTEAKKQHEAISEKCLDCPCWTFYGKTCNGQCIKVKEVEQQ